MVRRDEVERGAAVAATRATSRCASLAGENPASASVGAPSSRPQLPSGNRGGRAGRRKPATRRKPCNGEQARGPQHEVKPAASTEEQPGGRADHVAAKATLAVRDPKRTVGSGGVEGAARVQGEVRNTRDPSAWPSSGQGAPNKPKAKSAAAQRESEGSVVPKSAARAARTNAVQNNAAGGKGPCGGHAAEAGTRE